MAQIVSYTREGEIGVVTVDNPPVNVLSAAVRQGLLDALQAGLDDAGARALLLVCAGRSFIAGADITEFAKGITGPSLVDVIDRWEQSPKLTIAALHGTALGGGLEVALGCAYRGAVASARVGLPEVLIGILPGAGGTQRLPRVAGAAAALDMIVSGRHVPAPEAATLGVIDRILEGEDVRAAGLAYAAELLKEGAAPRRASAREDRIEADRTDTQLFARKLAELERTARNQVAPQACVRAVEAAVTLPFAEGMRVEQRLIAELFVSPQARALQHIFFAERAAAKVLDVPEDTPVRPIKRAAVIGAGTMGGGIAMNFANAGIPVTVLEVKPEALEKGLGVVRENYARSVKNGRMTQAAMDERVGHITGTLSYDDLAQADIVVEAVFESMAIKKQVFSELDRVCKPGAILASNTSTLDIDEIAAATRRPGDVIGLHFFSPANVMRLLEIVRGAQTAKDVIATSMKLGRTIAKVPVLVGNCEGFVGNRMVGPYGRQAEFMVVEGAEPIAVDRAITAWGMAMGPLAMGDLAGLDVGWRIRQGLRERGLYPPHNQRYSLLGDAIVESGRHGQKTARDGKGGWFNYNLPDRTPLPAPELTPLIEAERARAGIAKRDIGEEEIVKRLIYALVNEGARILEEGYAQRASDIDVIYVYGYGFPSYRGGPMFYADQMGLANVLADIRAFAERDPDSWVPAPLLVKLAESGGTFTRWKRG